MPKIKTHSGAKKRFKTTKSGKVKRAHAYTSHILTKKSTKRKRNLRKTAVADVTNQKQCKRLVSLQIRDNAFYQNIGGKKEWLELKALWRPAREERKY